MKTILTVLCLITAITIEVIAQTNPPAVAPTNTSVATVTAPTNAPVATVAPTNTSPTVVVAPTNPAVVPDPLEVARIRNAVLAEQVHQARLQAEIAKYRPAPAPTNSIPDAVREAQQKTALMAEELKQAKLEAEIANLRNPQPVDPDPAPQAVQDSTYWASQQQQQVVQQPVYAPAPVVVQQPVYVERPPQMVFVPQAYSARSIYNSPFYDGGYYPPPVRVGVGLNFGFGSGYRPATVVHKTVYKTVNQGGGHHNSGGHSGRSGGGGQFVPRGR